jgi:hypothetical protein
MSEIVHYSIMFSCIFAFPSLSLQHIIVPNIHFATVLYGSQKYFCCKKHFCMCESMYLMLANKVYLYFEGGTLYLLFIYVCVCVYIYIRYR